MDCYRNSRQLQGITETVMHLGHHAAGTSRAGSENGAQFLNEIN